MADCYDGCRLREIDEVCVTVKTAAKEVDQDAKGDAINAIVKEAVIIKGDNCLLFPFSPISKGSQNQDVFKIFSDNFSYVSRQRYRGAVR